MRRRVTMRPSADKDINEHLDFLVEENGTGTALRFLDAIEDACDQLLQMPKMGSSRNDLDSPLGNLRMWPVSAFSKYLIFYQPVSSGIEVVRIIYGTRDIRTLFEQES